MQPAQRNGVLLIALLAGALWASRVPWNVGLAGGATVPLPDLPERFGEWTSKPYDFKNAEGFENYAGSSLGGRRYLHPSGQIVDVFLVGTGRFDQFHTPQFCYATDGFEIVDERSEKLTAPNRVIHARRMSVSKPDERQDVLFWFQNGDTTADHRALIKLAALTRMLEGRRPAPLVLVRFSARVTDARSPLDAFVPGMLPYL